MSRFFHLAVACLALAAMQSLRAAEPPAPFVTLPQARQLTWQRMKYYVFVHSGLNTWTDRNRFGLRRDGNRWLPFAESEFSNTCANPIEQIVPLKIPISARYFRFVGLHAVEKEHVSAADVGVIAAP